MSIPEEQQLIVPEETGQNALNVDGMSPEEKALQEALNAEVQTALENIDPRPPRIKISRETQAFLMPDGSTEKEITGIILFHHKARGYWEEEGQQIPTCSSMDGKTGTDENGIEHNCITCAKNTFGSGKDGHGKACKEMRWIYILQEGEIIPSRISLPPTSLGKFDSFVTALAQKGIAPIQKIVTLSLESAESRGFKYSALAQPKLAGDTPRENILNLIQMRESVVAAARKAGIEAEDYFVDEGGSQALDDDKQPF